MTFSVHSKTWLQGSFCTLVNTAFVELFMHPLSRSTYSKTNLLRQPHCYYYCNTSKWSEYMNEHYGILVKSDYKELDNKEETEMKERSFISINAGNKHAAFLTNRTELIIIGSSESALSFQHNDINLINSSNENDIETYKIPEQNNISSWPEPNKRNCFPSSSISFSEVLLRWYKIARHREVYHLDKSCCNHYKEEEIKKNICHESICNKRENDISNQCTPHLIDLSNIFNKGFTSECKVVCGCSSTVVYQPNTSLALILGASYSNYIHEENHVIPTNNIAFERIELEEMVLHKKLTECQIRYEEEVPFASKELESIESRGVKSSIDDKIKIKEVVCGFNHMFIVLTSGKIFACGSNTFGELAIGTLSSPSSPKEVTFFEEHNVKVKKIAAGNSFSLFLTEDGRVYGCGSCQHGQLTMQCENPAFIPLLRGYVNESTNCELRSALSNHDNTSKVLSKKLIKIKDVACVGTVAVYVSVRNEILLQGSWEEFGFCVRSPRIHKVSQIKIKEAYSEWLLSHNEKAVENVNGFDIVELFTGPNTLLIRYKNGCIGGLGVNTEGELLNSVKVIDGKKINLATAFSATEVLPVLLPSMKCVKEFSENKYCAASPLFALGNGFILVVDDNNIYDIKNGNGYVHLPPLSKIHKQ